MCAPSRGFGWPGNANLPAAAGVFHVADLEIGVPGLKADPQAGADAGWWRDRGSGEQTGEIHYV